MNTKQLCMVAVAAFATAALAKDKGEDAWNEHDDPLAKGEKPCVTWAKLNTLDPGLKEVGRLAVRNAKDIKSSK